MQFAEKLESIDCRKDTKARRRLNDNPDTVCNITAEQIEQGVSLEDLDNCNTPVHCYGGQLTIHGLMPDFNPAARPNGYKSLIRNGNGSIGVRYDAVDAKKKAIIMRVSRLVKDKWHGNITSTACEISKNFYVKDEAERANAKAQTIAAMKSIPANRFFGSVYCYSLLYGMGYGVAAEIGAIPAIELWPFITDMFGIDETQFNELDRADKERIEAENIAYKIKQEADYIVAMEKKTARLARFAEFIKTIGNRPKVTIVPAKQEFSFIRYDDGLELPDALGQFGYKTITIKKRGFRYCYNVKPSVVIGYDYSGSADKWKMIEERHYTNWNKQAAEGLLYSSN